MLALRSFLVNLSNNKVVSITTKMVILAFAGIGFFLMSGFVAVKYHLTDHAGSIDLNDKYFQEMAVKHDSKNSSTSADSLDEGFLLYKLSVLCEYFPQNGEMIMHSYAQVRDKVLLSKMLDALDLYLKDNQSYQQKVAFYDANVRNTGMKKSPDNLFSWMNSEEWQAFRGGVVKDTAAIYRAARACNVPPRMIVTMMVSEQLRLFFSERESFKKFFSPLKILGNETKFSLGVSGIKDDTGELIEAYLKKEDSPFYPGAEYEKLLDYEVRPTDSTTISDLRYQRLTAKNHYYAYLYTGLYLKQIEAQWHKAGFNISSRPEILATLFNLGFVKSEPKANPQVGGTTIIINGRNYSYGSLAFEFYYSGELSKEFPFIELPENAASLALK